MKVFLGPAGLPMASEGNTIAGIKKIKELGLNAMEIEFVRQVYMNEKTAEEVGQVAKENEVRLSVHAPYYINLCSKDVKVIKESKERILKSLLIGEIAGADAVAVHAAYYSGLTSEQAYDKLKENVLDILDKARSKGMKHIKFGLETMGRESQFGSLDEIIKLCRDVDSKHLVPYIDWGHLFVRGKGKINYGEVFDKLKVLKLDHINSHFENVNKNKRGEFVDVHVPINGHPSFEPLAKEIVKRKFDITIISESPILEIDSLKMKSIFESINNTVRLS
ncbi:MAG: TIM barrel protein [Candidatus Aenigmarchaeota archaeon]|nr:TIM barrel protein [Candidatus Aenigmarchaeota archaeon]